MAAPGADWTLPLYELALQTAERADEMCLDPEITLSSHEGRPLEIFGTIASDIMEGLLQRRNIRFVSGSAVPEADRVVALPPQGPAIDGLPADADGFLPVDEHGRVSGVPGVWAAGAAHLAAAVGPRNIAGYLAQRSAVAASLLQRLGGKHVIHVVEGGIPLWKRENWPIEPAGTA